MAVFKCKMCGGTLEVNNETVATCSFCGTSQTLPRLDNEKKLALFSRANNLRIKSEFDKAAGIYESIIAEFRDEAEAYWGLVLCKYGIEYVDDGKGKRIPTCHRTLPISVMDDDDFQQACEYADITAKNIYRDEAKSIDKIQKKILDIALNEEPYDIFICYKETDDISGARTEDSLIAQDIYTQLLKDGYRVFFSRVSLREVAGTEYEPYIYAALSSAKIMLAIGTKHDYYDAVWVKNEWSRFISMMADDSSRVLIPCFRDMDAYDMPKEFKNMQALDMGEVTFFGSLMENIERILDKQIKKALKETIVVSSDASDIAPLLDRGFMFLEDNDWDKADEIFELALNKDPRNGTAYLGKLLADLQIPKFDNLSNFHTSFGGNNNYEKIMRFGNSELKENVKKCNDIIIHRNEEARKKDIYDKALQMMASATTEAMFENAGYMFLEVKNYLDAKEKSDECFEKGEIARIKAEEAEKDSIYNRACAALEATHNLEGKVDVLTHAVTQLESLSGWRDSEEKAVQGRSKLEKIKAKLEEERIERERMLEFARREKARRNRRYKKIAVVVSAVTLAGMIFFNVLTTTIIPNVKYNNAVELMEAGEYLEAIDAFDALNGYKDSFAMIDKCINANLEIENETKYNNAIALMEAGNIKEAIVLFSALGDFKESRTYLNELLKDFGIKETISTGHYHTIAIKTDGSVNSTRFTGSSLNHNCQCDFDSWTDIIAVSAGWTHVVGLKSDGTVVATGGNNSGLCDVSHWTDIIAVSAGSNSTIGLKYDGTLVAVGNTSGISTGQCNVSDWTNIVSVSAGSYHTVGLKIDGTVVAVGSNVYGQCDVSDWTDIIAVSAGEYHTVGVKSDGTVVVTGDNEWGQCDVSDWTDIVAVSAGWNHTVGLKSDGTVVATGNNANGQCNVSGWNNVIAISTCLSNTVGLKTDGTVVATEFTGSSPEYIEENYNGQCDVSDWTDIKLPD